MCPITHVPTSLQSPELTQSCECWVWTAGQNCGVQASRQGLTLMRGSGKDGHSLLTASAPSSQRETLSLANDLCSKVLYLSSAPLGTSAPSRDPCLLSRVISQSPAQKPAVVSLYSVCGMGGAESVGLKDAGG